MKSLDKFIYLYYTSCQICKLAPKIKQLSLNLLSHFHGKNVKVITTNNKINILCVSTLVRLN